MSRSGINVIKMTEGEQHKQRIYDCLLTKSMSRRECYETVKLTKNQFTHYINFLVEEGHVKIKVGKCALYKRDKVHILTANKDYSFVARTQEEIQAEVDEKNRREELIKPHVRVIRLINSRPYNFHKEKKNRKTHIQSSFNIL
jgi:hypothetical protein